MLQVQLVQDGNVIGVQSLNAKEFKTGSRGYHATTKMEIEGKKHQANFQFVEVGSKPKP